MKLVSSLLFFILFLTSVYASPTKSIITNEDRAAITEPLFNRGVGLIIGEPTGLTGKLYQGYNRAIDAGVAYSFNKFFLLYSDYLFQFPGLFGDSSKFLTELHPYLGAGAVLILSTTNAQQNRTYFGNSSSSVGFGVRIPFGTEWLPSSEFFGIFVELAPGVGFVPETFSFLEGGTGIRYYF